MAANGISLESAKENKLFYFVANVVVYRECDKRCLILKRDHRETVHPGKYALIGGKLEWADLDPCRPTRLNGEVLDYENAIERLLKREAKEEAGIVIGDELQYLSNVAFIRPDGVPVVLVTFAARYLSGKVELEKGAFTGFAWVNEGEIKDYDCIEGIGEEVARTIRIFEPHP